MSNEKKFCPQCGQIMSGFMRNCPFCGAAAPDPAAVPPPAPADDLTLQGPGEAAPAGLPNLQVFPERMKANKVLAERTCSGCAHPIELGDDVWNCQSCGNTMHNACHEQVQLCGNAGCATRVQAASRAAPAANAAGGLPLPQGETKPCRFCGEPILKSARKCRFCNEYQSDADRAVNEKSKKAAAGDDQLTGGDVAIGVVSLLFCPCIALVLGVVWMVQGKPKGWKMLLFGLIGAAIGVLVNSSRHGRF